MAEKTRYSDEELQEFKELILAKLDKAYKDYELLKNELTNSDGNDTADTYQLLVHVGPKCLEGEWRVSAPPESRYEIVERNHEMRGEYWGGFTRHNELWQQRYDQAGQLLEETLVVKNAAIMMYSPFLDEV